MKSQGGGDCQLRGGSWKRKVKKHFCLLFLSLKDMSGFKIDLALTMTLEGLKMVLWAHSSMMFAFLKVFKFIFHECEVFIEKLIFMSDKFSK